MEHHHQNYNELEHSDVTVLLTPEERVKFDKAVKDDVLHDRRGYVRVHATRKWMMSEASLYAGKRLLEECLTIKRVTKDDYIRDIADLPNLSILQVRGSGYKEKLDFTVTIRPGHARKVNRVKTLFAELILGHIKTQLSPDFTLPSPSRTLRSIEALVRYLATHPMESPVEVSIHTKDNSVRVFYNNGYSLTPLDLDSKDRLPKGVITIGNTMHLVALRGQLQGAKVEQFIYNPESFNLTITDMLIDKLKNYGTLDPLFAFEDDLSLSDTEVEFEMTVLKETQQILTKLKDGLSAEDLATMPTHSSGPSGLVKLVY